MFFIFYNVDVAMPRLPIANWALIGLTVVLSTALLVESSPSLREPAEDERFMESLDRAMEQHFGIRREKPSYPLFRLLVLQPPPDFRLTQLVGHLFAHRDVLHLAGNMVFLFCFGNAINAKFGHLFFLLYYLGIGALNALVFLYIGVGGIGASAAIWGLAGAFVVLYPKNAVYIWYYVIFNWGSTEISSLFVVGLYFVFELFGLFFDAGLSLSHLAHIVGGCWGFVATAILVKIGVIESTRDEENLLEVLGLD